MITRKERLPHGFLSFSASVLGANLLPLKTSTIIDSSGGGMDDAGASTVGVYSYNGSAGTQRGFCIKLYSPGTTRTAEIFFNRESIRFREYVNGSWYEKSVPLS